MAIAFDAANTGTSASSSSITISLTVASNSNRIVFGSISFSNNAVNISSMTYAAAAMTPVDELIANNSSTAVQRKTAPATGANNLVMTLTGSSSTNAGGGSSYYGVDQTTPLGTPVKNSSASGNPSSTVTSAAGELVVDFLGDLGGSGTVTPDAGQTQRWQIEEAGTERSSSSEEAGAASVVMSWTHAISGEWTQIAVAIKPAAAAAAAKITGQGLLLNVYRNQLIRSSN